MLDQGNILERLCVSIGTPRTSWFLESHVSLLNLPKVIEQTAV